MQNQDDKLLEKLKENANTLFPPNDHFGMTTTCGCANFAYEQERVMCDLQGFEILSHIQEGKPCYNYVRLKQKNFNKYKDISLHYVSDTSRQLYKDKRKFHEKQQNQKLGEFNYIHSKDIRPKKIEICDMTDYYKHEYVCDLIKKLFNPNNKNKNENKITYNYFHLNSTEEIPDITDKTRVFSTSNISDRVNASIGVVFVKGVSGKNYAIMCNHSTNKNIKEVKRIFEEDIGNTEIINLPQIQYDGNHCTILNKEFLSEMKKFFENKDIGKAINELKQIANNQDLAIQTFPKLYQYRQHEIDKLNEKIENADISMDNNINYLPNTDVYDFELLKEGDQNGEPKKRNIGLLIHGWQIALDYTLKNHEKISVIELEKFYNILTKQIDFFDNLIGLQIKNKDKKIKRYSELFNEKQIEELSKIVEDRKKNIKRDENDLITSANKVDQEYIKKRKQEIIDNINAGFDPSTPDFISKNIQKEITDYFNVKDFLNITRFHYDQYDKMKDDEKKKFNLETARKIFFKKLENQKQNDCLLCKRTKTPFEGNKLINKETIKELNKENKDLKNNEIKKEEEIKEEEKNKNVENKEQDKNVENKENKEEKQNENVEEEIKNLKEEKNENVENNNEDKINKEEDNKLEKKYNQSKLEVIEEVDEHLKEESLNSENLEGTEKKNLKEKQNENVKNEIKEEEKNKNVEEEIKNSKERKIKIEELSVIEEENNINLSAESYNEFNEILNGLNNNKEEQDKNVEEEIKNLEEEQNENVENNEIKNRVQIYTQKKNYHSPEIEECWIARQSMPVKILLNIVTLGLINLNRLSCCNENSVNVE